MKHDAADTLKKLYEANKPWLFVRQAVLIAAAADELSELLQILAGREPLPKSFPPAPPLEEWLPFYRSHRIIDNTVLYGVQGEFEYTATELKQSLVWLAKLPEEERRAEVEQWDQATQESWIRPLIGVPFPPSYDTIRAVLYDLEAGAETNTDPFEEFLADASGQFYFRVWLPCWLLYRTYPPLLFHSARTGNLDALEKLLRLDKSILTDKFIGRHWHALMTQGSLRDRQRFQNAITDGPKARMDPRIVRYGLAGLISQIARVFQCRVTSRDIAVLFDRIAEIQHGERDRLIPAGETFSKAVQRYRNWPSLTRQPDK